MLLVSLTPAQAQTPSHSWAVTYTNNGTWSDTDPTQTPPAQSGLWPVGSNGDSLSGSNTRNGSLQGTVIATLTWVPAAGQTMQSDPPPNPVSVIEYASAYEQSLLGTDPNTHGPAGSASDGLGDTPVVTGNGYTSSGYHALPPQDGSSGSIVLPGVPLSASNPPFSVTSGYPPYTRWPGGQTAVGLTVILPPPLQAHSTVDTANWNATRPRFFSGTDCSASGTAVAYSAPPGNASYPTGGTYVMQASLSISDTAVKLYYDTSFIGPISPDAATGTNQGSVPLSVFFDSTHFPDASTITARMNVTDSGGLSYMVPVSGPACNKLLGVANLTNSWIDYQTGENVALNATNGAVRGTSTQLNYQPYLGIVSQTVPSNISIGASTIGTHHKDLLITDIATSGYSVFFSATHADPGYLGDCYSLADSNIAAYLNDKDIQGAIATRTAALSAPYLFVFLHGCDSGGNTGLADDFGVTSQTDTGFVGFGAAISVSQHNTDFTVDAWQYLMQGKKLLDVLSAAAGDYPVQAYINPATSPQNSGTTIPVPRGDNNTTLYGKVYNWVSGPTWYR